MTIVRRVTTEDPALTRVSSPRLTRARTLAHEAAHPESLSFRPLPAAGPALPARRPRLAADSPELSQS